MIQCPRTHALVLSLQFLTSAIRRCDQEQLNAKRSPAWLYVSNRVAHWYGVYLLLGRRLFSTVYYYDDCTRMQGAHDSQVSSGLIIIYIRDEQSGPSRRCVHRHVQGGQWASSLSGAPLAADRDAIFCCNIITMFSAAEFMGVSLWYKIIYL